MLQIKNDHDFRTGWSLLIEAEFNAECRQERIVELKRNLRKYANRGATVDTGLGFMCERRIVKDNGIDGYVELVSIPEVFDTLEDDEEGNPGAETFFKDFFEIHARPSMYDCTGQTFTNWFKLFKRRGQFWAYHSVGFDV